MRQDSWVICDSETGYVKKLADYLRGKVENHLDIRTYSTIYGLFKEETGRESGVLIIEDSMYEEWKETDEFKQLHVQKVMCLTKEKQNESENGVQFVYKYQSGREILNSLLVHAKISMTGIHKKSADCAEMIGVYSPVKRTLKTSFSITLGQILAETEKVLYISLEGCSGLTNLLSLHTEKNLMDLLYEFSIYAEQIKQKLYQYIQVEEGLAIIPPTETISELQSVKENEWFSILSYLKNNSEYKKIILDIGDNVCGIVGILQLCDEIYMPYRTDYISMEKMKAFNEMLKKHNLTENFLKKIHRVCFPFFEDMGEGYINLKYHAFGAYVKNMVDSRG